MHIKLKDLSDYRLSCKDGEIGSIEDFYFDEKIWAIRYIVVNAGNWFFKNLVLISPIFIEGINNDKKIIEIDLTKEQIKNSPDIDTAKPISRQHEISLMDYYKAGYYWAGFDTWGAVGLPVKLRGFTKKKPIEQKQNNNIYLRSMDEVLGYKVAEDEDDFGRFTDMLVNKENWTIDYFVLNTNTILPGEDLTFNIRWIRSISYDERTVYLYSTKDAIEDME